MRNSSDLMQHRNAEQLVKKERISKKDHIVKLISIQCARGGLCIDKLHDIRSLIEFNSNVWLS